MIFGDYRRVTSVDDEAGVHAARRPAEGYSDVPYDVERGAWALWLPHDCDEWVIASGSADEVLAAGRQFRDAIEKALRHIEAQEHESLDAEGYTLAYDD